MTELRVLVSGHLPPPMGGIAAFYQSLLASSLPQRVNLRFVVTSSQRRSLAASGRATLANLLSAVHDCARFASAAWSYRPTVTHIATAFGFSFVKHSICILIARMAGSRVLLHPHCSLEPLYTGKPWWWRSYFRWVIRRTHGIIALSSEWEQLKEIVPGCPVYMLQNSINLSPFHAIAEQRFQVEPAPAPLHVFYIGTIGRDKGSFDLVMAAAASRPDLEYDLVGEEMYPGAREQLEQQACSLGLADRFRVHQPAYGPDKIGYFRQADIFVYPSYHEGMPIAVVEAMASGLPVIATRVGGLPDLVQDGVNGLLVTPGRPEDLAHAISQLASDEKTRRSMQLKAMEIAAERFDIEPLVARLERIYRDVSAGANAA